MAVSQEICLAWCYVCLLSMVSSSSGSAHASFAYPANFFRAFEEQVHSEIVKSLHVEHTSKCSQNAIDVFQIRTP